MIASLVLAAMMAGGPSAGPQHWQALSTTAMAVTGDVTMTPARMSFSDGKYLNVAYAGSGRDGKKTVWFYRITTVHQPILIRGNTICQTTPSYVAVEYVHDNTVTPTGVTIYVSFYNSKKRPVSLNTDGFCSSYTYDLMK
jgi:hypothetical protein